MLLIIAGMRRSASTLSYQIGCELAGDESGVGRINALPKDAENREGWHVVKTHKFLPQAISWVEDGKACVVTTIRDPRDIVVSVMTLRSKSFSLVMKEDVVCYALEMQDLWKQNVKGLTVCRYENFFNSLDVLVTDIAKAMNRDIGEDEIKRIAEKFSFENNKFRSDSATKTRSDLIFPGHIQDGIVGKWKTTLTPAQIVAVQEKIGEEWFIDNGYDYERL